MCSYERTISNIIEIKCIVLKDKIGNSVSLIVKALFILKKNIYLNKIRTKLESNRTLLLFQFNFFFI